MNTQSTAVSLMESKGMSRKSTPSKEDSIARVHAFIQHLKAINAWGFAESMERVLERVRGQ